MYLVRRVFKVKPGTARKAMEVIAQMGKLYEEAGQRSPTRVYRTGGSVTGPEDTVYMDWLEEALRPPHREGNKIPEGLADLRPALHEVVLESHIESYEMFIPR